MTGRLRFGLVGTGPWAAAAHAPALARHLDVDFVGVWGRNAAKAAQLADQAGCRAFPSPEALFDDVEAVALAVPPSVQPGLAVDAAGRGLHLVLEKPIAISPNDAAAVQVAVGRSGVASVVCFTGRWIPQLAEWLADLAARGGWECGRAELLSSAMVSGSGFAPSPWRRSAGALWDLAPHGVATLHAVLGDVTSVVARGGPRDLAHLIMLHRSGASSTLSSSISMPEAVPGRQTYTFDGIRGAVNSPTLLPGVDHKAVAYQRALDSLVHQVRSGARDEPCGVDLGVHVVDVLEAAERAMTSSSAQAVPNRPGAHGGHMSLPPGVSSWRS